MCEKFKLNEANSKDGADKCLTMREWQRLSKAFDLGFVPHSWSKLDCRTESSKRVFGVFMQCAK
ncbi:MAG: hypothetical protein DWI18_01525 [Planctomycetota bacterium]|nr:MAG: hypothetical protein DWI18_01525 [Planctomycetota bacterium]